MRSRRRISNAWRRRMVSAKSIAAMHRCGRGMMGSRLKGWCFCCAGMRKRRRDQKSQCVRLRRGDGEELTAGATIDVGVSAAALDATARAGGAAGEVGGEISLMAFRKLLGLS